MVEREWGGAEGGVKEGGVREGGAFDAVGGRMLCGCGQTRGNGGEN